MRTKNGKHGTKTNVAKIDSMMRKAENYAYKVKQESKKNSPKKTKKSRRN